MKISIFVGDLCDVDAEALCTSTNPHLSLAMGTGGSIRARGGYQILRECEEIVEAEFRRSGQRSLPAGSAHVTTSGELPSKIIVHCVASGPAHRSSADIVRRCVRNALARADAAECKSVAMPLFAAGHARLNFDRTVTAMAEALRDSVAVSKVQHIFIVVFDSDRVEDVVRLIRSVIGAIEIDVQRGSDQDRELLDMWSVHWSDRNGL